MIANKVIGHGLDHWSSVYPGGGIFLLASISGPSLRLIQPPVQWVLLLRSKWLECDTDDHLHPVLKLRLHGAYSLGQCSLILLPDFKFNWGTIFLESLKVLKINYFRIQSKTNNYPLHENMMFAGHIAATIQTVCNSC